MDIKTQQEYISEQKKETNTIKSTAHKVWIGSYLLLALVSISIYFLLWNEIPFYVAFQSDLSFVEQTIRSVAEAELGQEMKTRLHEMKELVKQTPVDKLEIKEYPFINFRVNSNTWVEVLLIYLVDPKKAATVRTNLIKKTIAALAKNPEKVMFPKGDSR